MQTKRLLVYLTGIAVVVIALSIITSVSYAYISNYMDFERSEGINEASVYGNTTAFNEYTFGLPSFNSWLNLTMFATYPKSFIESNRFFFANLTFLVTLNPNITSFQVNEIELTSETGYTNLYAYYEPNYNEGYFPVVSKEGNIPPFQMNFSLSVGPGHWPPFPEDLSHMLDFTDKYEAYPILILHTYWDWNTTLPEMGANIEFNLTSYPIAIYRFNFPVTLWLIYVCTISTIIAVPILLVRKRARDKTAPKSEATS